jgi:hypothetical protein
LIAHGDALLIPFGEAPTAPFEVPAEVVALIEVLPWD